MNLDLMVHPRDLEEESMRPVEILRTQIEGIERRGPTLSLREKVDERIKGVNPLEPRRAEVVM